ncbi:uncharacterized protein BDR25DRAFT_300831 [Lindgomyces ingoldianus]|uniref:Uncharacterized protein n=1 Tax=Lindgomyces ingoldianus TaxID=673940 RepID=A0ACB6R9F4_9PLEO|nr:uncharacterized protein BDR25DRAFT_300831 [Lindgomyces ingoldianus]KAF2475954.1 hypothetical protein BDR25DRAFT_300831 [Lindgomyces ingoldianus]
MALYPSNKDHNTDPIVYATSQAVQGGLGAVPSLNNCNVTVNIFNTCNHVNNELTTIGSRHPSDRRDRDRDIYFWDSHNNTHAMRGFVDTGSDGNFMALGKARLLGYPIETDTGFGFSSADGRNITIVGKFRCSWYINSRSFTEDFFVLRDPPCDVIIGFPRLDQLRLNDTQLLVLVKNFGFKKKEKTEQARIQAEYEKRTEYQERERTARLLEASSPYARPSSGHQSTYTTVTSFHASPAGQTSAARDWIWSEVHKAYYRVTTDNGVPSYEWFHSRRQPAYRASELAHAPNPPSSSTPQPAYPPPLQPLQYASATTQPLSSAPRLPPAMASTVLPDH